MSSQNTTMVNKDDIECCRKRWRYYAHEKTMKAAIFDWQDIMPITHDKDNKLWVVIIF